jgi:hypothetical protein
MAWGLPPNSQIKIMDQQLHLIQPTVVILFSFDEPESLRKFTTYSQQDIIKPYISQRVMVILMKLITVGKFLDYITYTYHL